MPGISGLVVRDTRGGIPLPVKLKVRSLYLVQQLPNAEIARRCNLDTRTVSRLIYREGWSSAKRGMKEKMQADSIAHTRAEVESVVHAVAVETEALTLGTLAKAHGALARDDKEAARDLQAYSQAAKNFVGMARQARGLDDANKAERAGSVVVFIGELDRVSAARPVHEVSASAVPALPAAGQPVTG